MAAGFARQPTTGDTMLAPDPDVWHRYCTELVFHLRRGWPLRRGRWRARAAQRAASLAGLGWRATHRP